MVKTLTEQHSRTETKTVLILLYQHEWGWNLIRWGKK